MKFLSGMLFLFAFLLTDASAGSPRGFKHIPNGDWSVVSGNTPYDLMTPILKDFPNAFNGESEVKIEFRRFEIRHLMIDVFRSGLTDKRIAIENHRAFATKSEQGWKLQQVFVRRKCAKIWARWTTKPCS